MKLILTMILIFATCCCSAETLFAGNAGVFEGGSSPSAVFSEEKKYQSSTGRIGGLTEPDSFVDRHAWRSGFAGTLVMWRRLVENAMPFSPPLSANKSSSTKKK